MASTPTLLWKDATRVGVQCLVASSPLIDYRALQADICEQVRDNVADGASLPVVILPAGDPGVIDAGTVVLLVHAAVQPSVEGGAPLLAFAVRPFRATSEQTAQLFGAPPGATTLSSDGRIGAAFGDALDAILSQTLPWRMRPSQARPIQ